MREKAYSTLDVYAIQPPKHDPWVTLASPFPSVIANSRAVTSSSGLPLHFPSQFHRTGGCLEATLLSALLPSFLQRKVPFSNTETTRQLSVSRLWGENNFWLFAWPSNTRINSPWTANLSLGRRKCRCEDAEHLFCFVYMHACKVMAFWDPPQCVVLRLCNIHMIWIQQYVRQAVLLNKKKCLVWPSILKQADAQCDIQSLLPWS